jgi:hypothetical protein
MVGFRRLKLDCKYKLEINRVEKAIRSRKESVQALKGVMGAKMIARMKKEAVECPVYGKTVAFVECFSCPNFVRRFKGEVHCRGEPLD